MNSLKRQHGLTIIELVMFMVIMGVAAAGIIRVLNIGAQSSADPLRRKQAMMIAEGYMAEVQQARFTFCATSDANAATANAVSAATDPNPTATSVYCTTPVKVGGQGVSRPYDNVADYAAELAKPQRSFAVNGVDVDVNGRPLGQDSSLNTLGNAALSSITTTVELNVLTDAAAALGAGSLLPNNNSAAITSSAADLKALRITIVTRYGTGANDFIQLDSYRTRYAPNYVP